MDPRDLKRILDALLAADVREFNLKTGEYELAIKRGPDGSAVYSAPQPLPAPTPVQSAPAPMQESAPAPVAAPAAPEAKPAAPTATGTPVKAPIVGTFYSAPSPDAGPYVKVGDRVQVGQILCIIEAMKLMNEIESEVAGVVREISVKNGEPVEYGQTLFLIEQE